MLVPISDLIQSIPFELYAIADPTASHIEPFQATALQWSPDAPLANISFPDFDTSHVIPSYVYVNLLTPEPPAI